MSLSTVMIVVTLIVIVPFGWFIFNEKSKALKKKKAFQKIASDKGLKLSIVEYWNNKCLGLDATENTMLFIDENTSEAQIDKIDLNDVRKCTINRTNTDYRNGDKIHSEMSRLDLEFTFISNKAPVRICLYNRDDNFSQNQEIQRAEKWLSVVDTHKYDKRNVDAA